MPTYVIFTPHSHCESSVRDCDTRAAAAADAMYHALIANGVSPASIIYIKHNTPRDTSDLNRFESRGTSARKELRDVLMDLYSRRVHTYLLEIHSFPAEWEPSQGRKLGIVCRPETVNNAQILAASMGGTAAGVHSHVGTAFNDIQQEFVSGRDVITPFLFEFAESQSTLGDDNMRSLINTAAARIVKGFEPAKIPEEKMLVSIGAEVNVNDYNIAYIHDAYVHAANTHTTHTALGGSGVGVIEQVAHLLPESNLSTFLRYTAFAAAVILLVLMFFYYVATPAPTTDTMHSSNNTLTQTTALTSADTT